MDKGYFMQACRDGGAQIEGALRALDAEFAKVLLRECRMVVRDAQRADDLVQETFIKVWQRCATYRGESELLAWIRSILRNAIVSAFRATKPEEPLEDEGGEMTHEVAESIAERSEASRNRPEDLLSLAEVESCYRACFARFETDFPLHAAVMRWVVEDGLGNAEIEALLQRTPGATREFISQCRKKARTYLAAWYAMTRTDDAG